MNSSPSLITRTAATCSSKGMSERPTESEAALTPRTSTGLFWSAEITVAMIWTSRWKPSGNIGRIGRSIRREVSTSSSVGLASRLK